MNALPDGAAPGYYVGELLAMTCANAATAKIAHKAHARQLGYELFRWGNEPPEHFVSDEWKPIGGRSGEATVMLRGKPLRIWWS